MTVRPWGGFIADFPDDEVGSERDIAVFGGRNVVVALGRILTKLGCRQVSEPDYCHEEGWAFTFYYKGIPFWSRVTSFHPAFWLLFEETSATRRARKQNAAIYNEIWRKLATAMERDPRFHKLLWRSLKDGPPDPDEIAAADDPPLRSFDEAYPDSQVIAPERRPGCIPIIIGLWFVLSGVMGMIVSASDDPHHRPTGEYITIGIVTIIVGLAILYWGVNRHPDD
ncbi:hypothetical protein [Phenylobacterium sp.]|uniref:hypothetical protein n=1 Tax=Phenylobacterium sp. TaxID=1871053 RepID=UPI00374D7412